MKLVNLAKYAALCGVSYQAIQARIQHGTVSVVEHTNPDESVRRYIDIEANPPVQYDNGRKVIAAKARKKPAKPKK